MSCCYCSVVGVVVDVVDNVVVVGHSTIETRGVLLAIRAESV